MRFMEYNNNNVDRFEEFKKQVIDIVSKQYEEERCKGLIEPIVFMGIEPQPTKVNEYFEAMKPAREQYKRYCNRMKQCNESPESKQEFLKHHMTVMGLPLGLFFSGAPESLNERDEYEFINYKKDMAVKLIKSSIEDVAKSGIMQVKYFVFVSEAFMHVASKLSEEQKLRMATELDYKMEHSKEIMDKVNERNGIQNMVKNGEIEAEDRVIFMFETRFKNQMVTFEMIMNEETNYCELINKFETEANSARAEGRFSNILFDPNANFGIN